MKRTTLKTLSAGVAALLLCGTLSAQQSDFDLSTQRSEKQQVAPVPGKRVEHHAFVVNPTPQQMTFDTSHRIDLGGGVALIDRHHKFADDLGFVALNRKGTKLTVDFGAPIAAKRQVKAVSGAYSLCIDAKGIAITGYDERGAFYGIQTLRQLLESPAAADKTVPYVQIEDFPTLPNRGVVEGFYGTPWSHAVRLSLIDFYGRFKMNTYLYGPKDDPYHSCPNWRLPYPEKEAQNIHELVAACNRNRVDFVWAIHPGQDITWDEKGYTELVGKFNRMYELGVRHFAIFFDDISGDGTDPKQQAALLNRLTDEFVRAKGDVSPLTVCPTDYSKLWANPTPEGSLAIYGKELYPEIKVFWTGDVVCSDMTPSTLEFINSRIRRPAYFWWNYPVTDYVRHILMQGPVYGLDTTLTDKEVCGVVSNPMEHGEASKLALYGVADYTWNPAAYNAIDNWERGLAILAPKAREAYRTFAIHSCDTENGYRRDESWETTTFRLADWTDVKAAALAEEFDRVAAAPAALEKGCDNRALLDELRPWLVEFGKLGVRGKRALELARIYRAGDNDALFWDKYVLNRMSRADREAYAAHKSGTMKLQPFYENTMNDMAHGFLERLSGRVPTDYRGIGSFASAMTVQTAAMFDHDTTTYYTSGIAQKAGDWIGVDLRAVRPVSEIVIRQGRNSTDDVDYFDHATVECSVDGQSWTPLTGELVKQYDIDWKGAAVDARYVRLKRLDSKRTNYASVRSFEVNPLRVEQLGFKLEAADAKLALAAFDGNPQTFYPLAGTLAFSVMPGAKSYTVLMATPAQPLVCRQVNAKGQLLAQTSLTEAYSRIEPVAGAVRITLTGEVEIFEIVAKEQ